MSDRLVGQRFAGRFDVEHLLAAGGMGAVYVATQQPTGRKVALKVIKQGIDGTDPTLVARFQREAETLAAISHPNIVTMFDSGVDDGVFFIVMELLSGQSLRAVLEPQGAPRQALPWSRASRIIGDVLRALSAVHAKGAVHRDLKPDNIFLTSSAGHSDFAKLLDFGIVRASTALSSSTPTESLHLTHTGGVIGTPGYLAPEQMRGEGVSPRSDLYAAGVILYEMVTGVFPFTAPTLQAMAIKQLIDPITPPRRLALDLPVDAERLILALLDRNPDNRPQTADDVLAALAAIDGNAPPRLPLPMTPETAPTLETPGTPTQAMVFSTAAFSTAALSAPTPTPKPPLSTSAFLMRAAAVAVVIGVTALGIAISAGASSTRRTGLVASAEPQPDAAPESAKSPIPTTTKTTLVPSRAKPEEPRVAQRPVRVRPEPTLPPAAEPVTAAPTTTPTPLEPPTATKEMLTRGEVAAPLHRDAKAIRACFADDKNVYASFTIKPDGTASDVKVFGPGGDGPRSCVRRFILGTTWPAGPGQVVSGLTIGRRYF